MDWWNDLTDWISSDDGWRVISGAIIPFVAIVVAGVIAALIGRGATKRVVAMQERESRNAAVAGIVTAARKAAAWGSLGHDERAYADHLAEDADIRLRMLPVAGAPLVANWTQHEIADIKKNSSTFSFQAEQSLAEFRERLLEWQARPSKARKLFKSDLERWKFDSPDPDAELISRQQDWNADQTDGARSADSATESTPAPSAERPTPTTTSLRPALRSGGTPAPASSAPTGAPAASAGSSASTPTSGAQAVSAAAAPARSNGAGFSVTRGGSAPADPNATTPISDRDDNATTPIADGNATRSYGDGATRSYGDTSGSAVRPTLGSPVSPSRSAAPTSAASRDDAPTNETPRAASPKDSDDAGPADDARIAAPTSADAHVNRSRDDGPDAARTSGTTSVPTRLTAAPAEPSDADETSESTYTQPISASELRRRAADDD
ncbi:hypothetical protein [Curtobacterium sp. L1-20]|uniref:hypothetical protein n=1 Tax=Curtobacterium sp. L1-20 TaxID=3138181 RepID=UPI003B527D05